MTHAAPLTLYVDSQYSSPYAMSAYVALVEKQVPFELKTLNLDAGEQHAADYAANSLTHRVPLLVNGDFALSESSAIAEYLEALAPAPAIYPSDIQLLAKARQVQAWLRSDLLAIRQERSMATVYFNEAVSPLSADALKAAAKLIAGAQTLLAHGGDNLLGDWSIADTDLAMMLNRLAHNHDDVPQNLIAYVTHQLSRPSVQAWMALPR